MGTSVLSQLGVQRHTLANESPGFLIFLPIKPRAHAGTGAKGRRMDSLASQRPFANPLSVYGNQEIGEIFGVGYTAITEAVKRGQEYLESGKRLGKKLRDF